MRYFKALFVAVAASVMALGLAACENGNDEFGDQPQQPDQQFSVEADTSMGNTPAADEGDWDWPEEDEEDDGEESSDW